ncbi:trk system potassium uptake protein [Methylomarinovum caldicuralii]|uniref:Trk system potassium uptake protein n=1 Tax=Methylomarinovum caldicuralii TaxID=438856 RepID=A0AAU9C1Y1_9GAMM|nr:TrkH family potassium uptake protein [Methylomarinovum caldicuralii]BCX82367.1 trk system potassium uptake protein [Methylomarinovum caldicuralii]
MTLPTVVQVRVVLRIIGALLVFFSFTLLPPLGVSLYYRDGAQLPFVLGFLIVFGCGLLVWWPFRQARSELRVRDGFLVVALLWIMLSLTGAVPLALATRPHLSLTDAVFEAVSGLTTTGATVVTGLDTLPRSLLYYRQQLQWLGGMGIVVLAVAVLPLLRVGGMQLYRAEAPGPMKDTKLTPRIAETAKALWGGYLGLTLLCVLSYWGAGMSLFDAVAHAFATVAIGGFSTHDASLAYFRSPEIEVMATLFMLLAGVNFTLHFEALRKRRPRVYLSDSEMRVYLGVIAMVAMGVSGYLWWHGGLGPEAAVRYGLFQTVSFLTTTGFTSTDYSVWPPFVQVLLIFAAFVGGCAGSTAGGLKVIRVLLLYKQGIREILRLIHPQAEIPVKVGKMPVSPRVVEAVWGFFSLYVVSFAAIMAAMMAFGLDQVTAFSAVAACLNNLGPGLGEVTSGFMTMPDGVKWLACFAMLLGRLEIFTLLVLLTPAYWRS